jgi:uncharacterized membrane protein YgcG
MKELMQVLRMRMMVAPVAAAAGLAVAVAGGAPAGATTPVKSSSSLTSFHGTVTSVSTANRTFKLRRANGTTRTFRVTSATVYERLSGLSSLRSRAVEVKGKRVDGRWVARKIEPDDDASGDDNSGDDNGGSGSGSGGSGGSGGGSGRGGADDGPNHDAGDDHGSGGHGSDD